MAMESQTDKAIFKKTLSAMDFYYNLIKVWKIKLGECVEAIHKIDKTLDHENYLKLKKKIERIIANIRFIKVELKAIEVFNSEVVEGKNPQRLPRYNMGEYIRTEEKLTYQLASELDTDPSIFQSNQFLKLRNMDLPMILSDKEVRKLRVLSHELEQELTCIICFDPIELGALYSKCPDCESNTHLNHMKIWLSVKPRCPLCNIEVSWET